MIKNVLRSNDNVNRLCRPISSLPPYLRRYIILRSRGVKESFISVNITTQVGTGRQSTAPKTRKNIEIWAQLTVSGTGFCRRAVWSCRLAAYHHFLGGAVRVAYDVALHFYLGIGVYGGLEVRGVGRIQTHPVAIVRAAVGEVVGAEFLQLVGVQVADVALHRALVEVGDARVRREVVGPVGAPPLEA